MDGTHLHVLDKFTLHATTVGLHVYWSGFVRSLRTHLHFLLEVRAGREGSNVVYADSSSTQQRAYHPVRSQNVINNWESNRVETRRRPNRFV